MLDVGDNNDDDDHAAAAAAEATYESWLGLGASTCTGHFTALMSNQPPASSLASPPSRPQ